MAAMSVHSAYPGCYASQGTGSYHRARQAARQTAGTWSGSRYTDRYRQGQACRQTRADRQTDIQEQVRHTETRQTQDRQTDRQTDGHKSDRHKSDRHTQDRQTNKQTQHMKTDSRAVHACSCTSTQLSPAEVLAVWHTNRLYSNGLSEVALFAALMRDDKCRRIDVT